MKNINLEKIRTLVFIVILILSVIGSLVGIFAYSDDVGDAPRYYSIIDLSFSVIGLGLVFFIQKSKFIKNLFTVFILILFVKSIIFGSFYGKFNFLLYEVPFYSGLIYYLSDPVTREKQNISLALLLVSVISFIFQIVLSF